MISEPPAIDSAISSLGGVATRITVDEATAHGHPLGHRFLRSVRNVVLLSLAAGGRSGTGQELLHQLGSAGATVRTRMAYKEEPSSLLAFVGGLGAYCVEGLGNPFGDLHDRLSRVRPGGGDPSEMAVPVWLTGGRSAGELVGGTFDHVTVDEALDR
ncbi:MAG: hypothetical protein LC799_11465, partial [Actinobacteria bacterium]|nr:hypothetical protein [Actinomycetota bacterium]